MKTRADVYDGKNLVVLHSKVKNQRLAAARDLWAFAALPLSLGATAHYDRCRVAGDWHRNVTYSTGSSAASSTYSGSGIERLGNHPPRGETMQCRSE